MTAVTAPATLLTPGDDFIHDAAWFAAGGCTVEQIAALHGLSADQVLETLAVAEVATRVDRAVAEANRDGSAIRLRARAVLDTALGRLGQAAHAEDASPTFLLRVAEVLAKLAIDPKAEARVENVPTFSIHIDIGEHGLSVTGVNNGGGDVVDI